MKADKNNTATQIGTSAQLFFENSEYNYLTQFRKEDMIGFAEKFAAQQKQRVSQYQNCKGTRND